MRSHRGGWLSSWVLGAILVLAPAVSTTVHAQPGFGPDPFWPYNNQYTPYTTAVGPASPDAGQGSAVIGRQGYTTANQFQQYLDGMSAPGRNLTDRAGVGVPYFSGSVDPAYGNGRREYRPNARADEKFEDRQRELTAKYFDYFKERDPKKRAELLREYQRARRDSARDLLPRSQSPSRVLSDASGTRPGSGASRASRTTRDGLSASVALPREPGTISRPATSPDSATDSTEVQSRTMRPAPPMPSVPGSPGGRARSTPSSVLNRARAMGDRTGRTPGSSSATTRSRRPATPPPSGNDD
jgi:hypothetical protein